MGLRLGKETLCLSMHYTNSLHNWEFIQYRFYCLTRVSCAEVLLKMQSGDISFVKQVSVLSRNEI